MTVSETPLKGLYILEPHVIEDNRGFFMESYNSKTLRSAGITTEFVQDNHSLSVYGVIRGLHFQNPPFEQTKLIRSISGEILDVVVDIRKESPTFGQHFSILLSSENKKQLFVPPGFAHGFAALTQTAEIHYKCDQFYNKEAEGSVLFNDPKLGIDWRIDPSEMIISDKDLVSPNLDNLKSRF